MKASLHLTSLFMLLLAHMSTASIPSLGQSTAQAVRSKLPDNSFRIRASGKPSLQTKDFKAFLFGAMNTPSLAATDTQFFVAKVQVKPGRPFVRHSHPRASELLTVTGGRMRSTFWFEGMNPRAVTNILETGDSVVFPQGLVHDTVCLGPQLCSFNSVQRSGDSGLIPA